MFPIVIRQNIYVQLFWKFKVLKAFHQFIVGTLFAKYAKIIHLRLNISDQLILECLLEVYKLNKFNSKWPIVLEFVNFLSFSKLYDLSIIFPLFFSKSASVINSSPKLSPVVFLLLNDALYCWTFVAMLLLSLVRAIYAIKAFEVGTLVLVAIVLNFASTATLAGLFKYRHNT
jgi:hypothetical protein